MDNQEDLARIQEFTLKSNFAALIEESVHKILYEATFYKGLDPEEREEAKTPGDLARTVARTTGQVEDKVGPDWAS